MTALESDDAATAWFQTARWPSGPVCPHCAGTKIYATTKNAGGFRCAAKGCSKDFSVTAGTFLERRKLSLRQWLSVLYSISAEEKINAHQISLKLDIQYRTAWHMADRIRHALELTE